MKRVCSILALLCVAVAFRAEAADRVLLIGVSNYAPEVEQLAGPLTGPGSDVSLMAGVFLDAGVSQGNIEILSDVPTALGGQLTASQPTRFAILKALDDLAETAQAGDRITIFMAGHGSQLPARDAATEPDGLDEIFLPLDFTFSETGVTKNAILDDEIGHRIDRMIAVGADVWLIADTCHSGSLRRSAGTGAVARFVNLGVQASPNTSPERPVDLTAPETGRAGQYVGFYGAAAGALAYETRPPGAEATHGLLTWSLANALRSGRAESYADLARLMSARIWRIGHGRAEPAFSGALRARHMFSGKVSAPGLYAVAFGEGIEVKAGQIDGIVPGTRIQVEDADGATLFETSIENASLLQADAPIPDATEALDARLRDAGLDPNRFRLRWLQDRAPGLVARVIATPMQVALPLGLNLSALDPSMQEQVTEMVDRMQPTIRHDDIEAELQLVAEGETIFLRPAPEGAATALSVPADPDHLAELEAILRRAAKTRGLLSVANALRDAELSRQLALQLQVTPGALSDRGDCQPGGPVRAVALDRPYPPDIVNCDEVSVTVLNRSEWPADITPLYLAANHEVYFLTGYEGVEKGGWRIPPKGQATLRYTEVTQTPAAENLPTGPMHLILFAQRGRSDAIPVDFRHLQDSAPPPERRSEQMQGLAALLTASGFGLAKTRSIDETSTAHGGALVIPLTTVRQRKAVQGEE